MFENFINWFLGTPTLVGMDENTRQDVYGRRGGVLSTMFDGGKDSLGYQLGTLGLGLYSLFQNNNNSLNAYYHLHTISTFYLLIEIGYMSA